MSTLDELSRTALIARVAELEERVADLERKDSAHAEDLSARFRAVASATPYPLFIASRHARGRLLYGNASLKEAFGFEGEPTDQYAIDFFWDPSERAGLLDQVDRTGQRISGELRQRRANGEMFWTVTSSVALEFDGEAALLTSFFDITDRKAAEEELVRYRDSLEQLVSERTEALESAQDELLRNERLAAIGQLTGTVAHELRNPLGTVKLSHALLESVIDPDDKNAARVFERITRNLDRCTAIIDQLLDYSRIRTPHKVSVDIDEWLRETIEEQAIPADVERTLALHANTNIPIDRDRVRQCVINVVDNACQAMSGNVDRTRRLTISTRSVDDQVEMDFSDTGAGIDADKLERVFEPLFSTKSFGVGLGLPLVKQVLEEHDGVVEVESETGRGTRVTLRLPVSEDVTAPTELTTELG